VINFFVGTIPFHRLIIRKAMGKGNGVDERHGMKKEAPEW
jgi:hypothetical protein